jgi:DNA-binding transcriptional ArsR family regulator
MTVNEIVNQLDGNQPNISKHLQILFDTGLVGRRRSGNSIFYSIADPVVFRLCELVCRSAGRQAKSLHKYAHGKSADAPHRRSKSATMQGAM